MVIQFWNFLFDLSVTQNPVVSFTDNCSIDNQTSRMKITVIQRPCKQNCDVLNY